ncbi:MAG: hypothetical protein IT372_36185 [Polyangiaceae bacterium]|nr:hypothetical protein [Polyangiaceae bacterium]
MGRAARPRRRVVALASAALAGALAGALWLASSSGCALVVGADFDDKTLRTCEPCYTGPPQTESLGACVAGCQDGAACAGQVVPVIEDCATVDVDESCDGARECDGEPVIALGFGSSADQAASRVAVAPDGTMVLAADAPGRVNYGGGLIGDESGVTHVHVARLDPAGAHRWSKSFGAGSEHHVGGLAVADDGGVLLTGYVLGGIDLGGGIVAASADVDLFVAKLDADGNHVWSEAFGEAGTQVTTDLVPDAQQAILIGGFFAGALTLGGAALAVPDLTGVDAFVAKLSPDGEPLWARQFGDAGEQYTLRVAAGPNGEVALTGFFTGVIDFGGGPISNDDAEYDGFVAVLGPAGDHLWSHSFRSPARTIGTGVTFDREGRLYVTGYFGATADFGGQQLVSAGVEDIFLVAYDGGGNIELARSWGDAGSQAGHAVRLDAAGNLIIVGSGDGAIDFGAGAVPTTGASDAFAFKLDRTGNLLWGRVFGADGAQAAADFAPDPLGNLVVTGSFENAIGLGATQVTAEGARDIWLAKLRP